MSTQVPSPPNTEESARGAAGADATATDSPTARSTRAPRTLATVGRSCEEGGQPNGAAPTPRGRGPRTVATVGRSCEEGVKPNGPDATSRCQALGLVTR